MRRTYSYNRSYFCIPKTQISQRHTPEISWRKILMFTAENKNILQAKDTKHKTTMNKECHEAKDRLWNIFVRHITDKGPISFIQNRLFQVNKNTKKPLEKWAKGLKRNTNKYIQRSRLYFKKCKWHLVFTYLLAKINKLLYPVWMHLYHTGVLPSGVGIINQRNPM